MSRKVLFTLATAATLAAAATLASSAADARGFGGGGGGFGGGHFGGGGGFSRSFGGGFGGGHIAARSFGGRSFARVTPIRGGYPGFPGRNRWAYHHHHHWFFRDGRWIFLDGVDGGYDQPVAAVGQPVVSTPGPCTCLTKTYTPDGLVVFADVCTKEAASARVDGADITTLPPANSSDKSSDATPAPAPTPTAQADNNVVAQASQAPTTTNYAGKTYQDFLAANAQAKKN
jgi:hypothetical protein